MTKKLVYCLIIYIAIVDERIRITFEIKFDVRFRVFYNSIINKFNWKFNVI